MNKAVSALGKWTERSSATGPHRGENEDMFQLLFERSPDAIWLMDPSEMLFVDCNNAAIELLRAKDKAQLLGVHPAELSPPLQPDGQDSRAKAAAITELTQAQGTQRFEWVARRFDGTEVPLEVATIPILSQGRRLNVVVARDITERKLAEEALRESERKFRQLFEASSDSILILDPETLGCVDCNAAAARMGAEGNKQWLIGRSIFELSPERQPDGRLTREATRDLVDRVLHQGPQRLEWTGKRSDGADLPLEVVLTPIRWGERTFLVSAARDITERKRAEQEIRELNQSLERRIAERTAELAASEARFRALVEHAPEAIVVFDGQTGRFLFGNQHTCRIYGVGPEDLTRLTPEQVCPEFQADGRRSSELAREKMNEALAGGTPVFEWIHRHTSGRLLPTEVRLVRLPDDRSRPLLRASIIDNTERKRREAVQQATFQISEAAHTADNLSSFYARVHSIMRSLMPARNFYIALLQPETATIAFPYFVDEYERAPDPFPLGTGLTGYVLRSGKPLLVGRELNTRKRRVGDEVTYDGLPELHYIECGKPAAIWLGVPLRLGGTTLGVMAVQDYHNDEAYGEEDIRILTFMAEQTALALERKRSEQALRESEEKFRALFAASSQGVMLHDEQQYLEVNPAAVRILGYRSEEELIGKHPRDTSPPFQPGGERSDVLAAKYIQQCLAQGSARFDWVGRTAQGRDIPVEVTLTRIQWTGRQIIQACVSDISERKRAEAELRASEARLRESEARFSAAFRASPVWITISDMNGHYVLVNEAFLGWTGYRREEVLGRTSADIGAWENLADREIFWEELRRTRSIRERETRVKNRRGDIFTMLLSVDMIEINGAPHVLTMGTDITQRKHAEAELRNTLAREKELGQLKSNFVSMVSHEFRTPLGIIQSSAEILRDYFERLQPAERENQLESIVKNTRRMAEMMEEILVLSRLDAGKMDFKPASLDLDTFCRRIVDEVLSATDRRCPIELSLASFAGGVVGDERLLSHILTNLLSNAAKYSNPGSPVVFAVQAEGDQVVFTVRDRGIGIPATDQQWLFTAFHRGSNVGERPGSGLGLVLVKRCVELHGGQLQLESKVGFGTTATVRLPLWEGKS